MADDATVKFGADVGDLQKGIDKVLGMFGEVTKVFAGMAAAVAGGEAFKAFIDQTVELNSEARKLSQVLGITADQAGTLNTALGDIGSNAESYTGAFLHFERQLRNNSDAMKAMGVDTDALRNGTKDSNQVFQEAIRLVGQYKAGHDQATAAQTLFGRSVEEVYKLQKLTNEVIDEAAKKNKALNLTITQEGLEASRQYKLAMNDVGDVLKGVSKTIGEAVIPHFTAMAEQFASIGPTIVEGMGAAIQVVITLWDTFADVVSTVWDTVSSVLDALFGEFFKVFGEGAPNAMEIFKAAITAVQRFVILFGTGLREIFNVIGIAIELVISRFRTFAAVSVAAFHLDWDGVKTAWQEGTDRAVDIVKKGVDRAVKIAQEGQAKLEGVNIAGLGIPQGTPGGKPKGGGKTAPLGTQNGNDPRIAAMLALQKAQQEASLALQLEYLKEAADQYDVAYAHNLLSIQQFYDSKLAIEQQANALSLAAKRQELADAQAAELQAQAKSASAIKSGDKQKYEAEVLKFKTEQVKIQGQINILEAQALDITRKNANERADAERKLTEQLANNSIQRTQQRANSEIAIEKGAIDQLRALRVIDDQTALQMQKDLEDKSYSATIAALQAKRALVQGDNEQAAADRDAINVQMEAAEQAHQQRLTQIDQQAVLERKNFELQAAQSIQAAWSQSTQDFLNGQKSLWGALKSFLASTLSAINRMISDTFAQKLFGPGTSGGGMLGSMLDFIGGRASGGPILPGQFAVVGENGPELAMVNGSGAMVLPNNVFRSAMAAGGSIPSGGAPAAGSTTVVQNINIQPQGPIDNRTQQQIFAGIGRAVQTAMRRST